MALADAASATSCFPGHLLLPPRRHGPSSIATQPLAPSLTLLAPSPLLCFSHAATEWSSSPPSTATTATGPPSLPRLAHKLRHSVLDPPHRATPLQKPPKRRPDVFPLLGPAGRRRPIRRLRTVPGLVSASNGSAVSLRCFSCARPLRSRPLAPSPTAAESFSPPAMAWPWPQPPQLVLEPTVVLTTVPGAHSTHQRLPWRPASPNPSLP